MVIEDERYKVYLDRRNQEIDKWLAKIERWNKKMLVKCAFFGVLGGCLGLVCWFRSCSISKIVLCVTILIYLGISLYWIIKREFFLSMIEKLFDKY